MDKLFNKLKYEELKFRNQSYLSIVNLIFKYNNLGDYNNLMSNMSEFDININKSFIAH